MALGMEFTLYAGYGHRRKLVISPENVPVTGVISCGVVLAARTL